MTELVTAPPVPAATGVTVSMRLAPSAAQWISDTAGARGASRAQVVEALLRSLSTENQREAAHQLGYRRAMSRPRGAGLAPPMSLVLSQGTFVAAQSAPDLDREATVQRIRLLIYGALPPTVFGAEADVAATVIKQPPAAAPAPAPEARQPYVLWLTPTERAALQGAFASLAPAMSTADRARPSGTVTFRARRRMSTDESSAMRAALPQLLGVLTSDDVLQAEGAAGPYTMSWRLSAATMEILDSACARFRASRASLLRAAQHIFTNQEGA